MPASRKSWDPRQKGSEADFDVFMVAYIDAALWSSMDEEGVSLDDSYSADDIEVATGRELERESREFIHQNWDLIKDDLRRAGYDFWMTRNDHGIGFWAGGWPEEAGKVLTKNAKAYGHYTLLVGADEELHGVSG